jgi:hypothetical protein
MAETRSFHDGVQIGENERKKPLLNYKSVAFLKSRYLGHDA